MESGDDALDPHAILALLGVTDIASVEQAHGGTDTVIWRVEAAGRLYALRVFQQGSEADCEREREVMQAARDAGLPVPEVHAHENWRGRPALLLSWLPGQPLATELRRHPWRAWRLGVRFGEMQARLNAVTAPVILTERPSRWIDWLGPDQPALAAQLRAGRYQRDALLHLDYHPLNVLTDGQGITAVLDWRNAAAGEPRADAARAYSILRVVATARASWPTRIVLWTFTRGWRAGYQRVSGRLREMAPFYAWAGAVAERDLAEKRPAADLARIHQWTRSWLARM